PRDVGRCSAGGRCRALPAACSVASGSLCLCFFFFFQAEDGIRGFHVTGVQTCALPISAHLMPVELPAEVAAALPDMLAAVCAELGYRTGPLTFDAVLGRDGKLYLIEMGARMGGNGIAEVVESCYGVDLMAATMSLAVGEQPTIVSKPPTPTLVHILASDRTGRLCGIDGVDEVRAMPEVL